MSVQATYCPEDNKLRLYSGRVDRATFEQLREAGYKSTPKQNCDFVATWSIRAEDIALSLIDEDDDIGDEDYSPEDRAADRAERFAGYRDKRRREALGLAEVAEDMPTAVGSQNEVHATRSAQKIDRTIARCGRQWEKAEYWQTRTRGVIANALHKSDPETRRGRILRLESEQRKHLGRIAEVTERREKWARVAELDGADTLLPADRNQWQTAHKAAYALANYGHNSGYKHPTNEAANVKHREIHRYFCFSLYDFLTDADYHGISDFQLTPRQVAELYLRTTEWVNDPESTSARVTRHYENRLAYENAMLENEGGKVSEVEIIPGGFIGKHQVLKVHKSNATKRVVSVTIFGTDWSGRPGEQKVNIERLGADAYRAPTPEELAEFTANQKAKKAIAKASTPKSPPLVNPTIDDARKLQEILNSKRRSSSDEVPEVYEMTQAVYSANSNGSYAACETEGITEQLEVYKPGYYGGTLNQPGQVVVFKVRMYRGRVIVLTDKPQKAIPWAEVDRVAATWPTLAEAVELLREFPQDASAQWSEPREAPENVQDTFRKLQYHGLTHVHCWRNWGLSKLGWKYLSAMRHADGDSINLEMYGLTERQAAELLNDLHATA